MQVEGMFSNGSSRIHKKIEEPPCPPPPEIPDPSMLPPPNAGDESSPTLDELSDVASVFTQAVEEYDNTYDYGTRGDLGTEEPIGDYGNSDDFGNQSN